MTHCFLSPFLTFFRILHFVQKSHEFLLRLKSTGASAAQKTRGGHTRQTRMVSLYGGLRRSPKRDRGTEPLVRVRGQGKPYPTETEKLPAFGCPRKQQIRRILRIGESSCKCGQDLYTQPRISSLDLRESQEQSWQTWGGDQRCSTWYLYLYSSCTRVQIQSTCTRTCHLELQVLIQVHRED